MFLYSQEDLLGLIEDDTPKTIPVKATFKATRIVNAQSIEMPKPKILEFMIMPEYFMHPFMQMSHLSIPSIDHSKSYYDTVSKKTGAIIRS